MSPSLIVTLLLFAPLLGAAIAGLTGRRIGDIASQSITTGLLLVACALGWFTFINILTHAWAPFTVNLAPFITVGDFKSYWSVRDADRGHHGLGPGPYL
jgi:NADH-quinone oxidoreductase subunit L